MGTASSLEAATRPSVPVVKPASILVSTCCSALLRDLVICFCITEEMKGMFFITLAPAQYICPMASAPDSFMSLILKPWMALPLYLMLSFFISLGGT